MPPPRIALDVTPAARQTAGVGRYTRELARALLARGANDYVLVVTDRLTAEHRGRLDFGSSAPPVRGSVLTARAHTIMWHRLRLPVPAELWSARADVYHATDFLVPPLLRARAVVTVHDLSFLRTPDRADPRLRAYLTGAVPRSVRRAHHVLADSENTRRDVIELLGVEAGTVTVAYPGVGPDYRPDIDPGELARVREAYGLDRPFVLGVGTLEPRKDWPTLIEAFERSQSALGGHALVIAGGRGWMTEGIDAAVASTSADVRLLGFVPDEDLPALYGLSDAFAYPSVYEGFGLPPLEALACGVPTVVSDASCLPEVVADAALTVPVGDAVALGAALTRLTADAALRRALAERGPRRAARFTWDACAAAAERAYEAVRPG